VGAGDDKDWCRRKAWRGFRVHAGPFVVAGAHELARIGAGKIPVWIEAGPAFGTGHHGTTRGCLEALAHELQRKTPARVLDIGTGSGVLAIAAVKAGARFCARHRSRRRIDPHSRRRMRRTMTPSGG